MGIQGDGCPAEAGHGNLTENPGQLRATLSSDCFGSKADFRGLILHRLIFEE